jgi:hypothetical protein
MKGKTKVSGRKWEGDERDENLYQQIEHLIKEAIYVKIVKACASEILKWSMKM